MDGCTIARFAPIVADRHLQAFAQALLYIQVPGVVSTRAQGLQQLIPYRGIFISRKVDVNEFDGTVQGGFSGFAIAKVHQNLADGRVFAQVIAGAVFLFSQAQTSGKPDGVGGLPGDGGQVAVPLIEGNSCQEMEGR